MSKANLKQLLCNRIQLVLELPTLGEADIAVLANSINCLEMFLKIICLEGLEQNTESLQLNSHNI